MTIQALYALQNGFMGASRSLLFYGEYAETPTPIPIACWLIKTSEGLVLFDTGVSPRAVPGLMRNDPLARLKLAQMCASHRLHVHEDVLAARFVRPLDEAIAANAVEPFDLHRLELAGRIGKRPAVRAFRGGNGRARLLGQGRAEVDGQDALRLQPALEPHRHAFDDRAFGHTPSAMLAQDAEVQQHVTVKLVAD
jgi:hypothetical protein